MSPTYNTEFQAWLQQTKLTEADLRAKAAVQYGVAEADVTAEQVKFIQSREFFNDAKFWVTVR